MLMQNLVLVVQNTVRQEDMGAASAAVAFFRSLGGAVGVAALGALLASRVTTLVTDGLAEIGVPATAGGGSRIPDLATLPAPVRTVVESAYGEGVADIFLAAAPLGVIALVAVALLREVPLGTRSGIDIARQEAAVGGSPVGVTAADAAGLDWEAGRAGGPGPASGRRQAVALAVRGRHQVQVVRVPRDEAADERAGRPHRPPARPDLVEGAADQHRAEPLALVRGVDLGVGEDVRRVRRPGMPRSRRAAPSDPHLEPLLGGVVDHGGVHAATVGRRQPGVARAPPGS